MLPQGSAEIHCRNEDNKRVWNVNAAAWDEAQGQAGNAFQRELVFPAAEQLLDIPARHYEKVLEIGCGNGSFARRLSASGAVDHVLATDFSQEQLRRARHQTPAHEHPRLRFAALDATRRSDLEACGEDAFDAAVLNMVVMDMPDISALASGLRHVLKPGGVVVVVLPHPCFNSTEVSRAVKKPGGLPGEDPKPYLMVEKYLGTGTTMGVAVPSQPEQQYYFHRPLSALCAPFFEAGFLLGGFLEPTVQPPLDYSADKASMRQFMWYEFAAEFPWVIALRFVLPASQ